MKPGQALGNSPKPTPDRLDRKPEKGHQCRSQNHHNDGPGHAAGQPLWPKQDDRYRAERQRDRGPLHGPEVCTQRLQLLHEVRRHRVQIQTEEILDLGTEDQHGDSAGEPHRDRVGDEFDHRAHPRESHHQQYDARHHRTDEQIIQAIFGDDPIDNHDKRSGRSANLDPRPAQRGNDEAGNHGGENSGLGLDAGSDSERHGQWQRDDADREPGNQVREQIRARIILQCLRQPGAKGKAKFHPMFSRLIR